MKDKIDATKFQTYVFEIVKLIPAGRATSYGAIAKAIGYPTRSRLVGRVLGNCSLHSEPIPAHRVVNNQGVLSGKDSFATPTTMQERLEEEGITIENNRIRNWKAIYWNPSEEVE